MASNTSTNTVNTATAQAAPAELSAERVHAIFSQIAKKYNQFNALSSMGIYKIWLNNLVKTAKATSETRMLDLAAGTGDVSFAVASKTPPASIVVTDFCKEMLDVARYRYEQGAAAGVPCEFAEVDALDIPYPDESFDLVTCAYGVRNFPDRAKAFSEAYRVLKTGGRYAILEFSTPPNVVWRGMYHVYLKNVIPFIGGLLTKNRQGFVYLNDSIRAFPRQETLVRFLYDAGFSAVDYKNYSGGIAAIHTAIK